MSRLLDGPLSPRVESLLTDPVSQARLAAQLPWWGWAAVAAGFAMAAMMIWYLWPGKPRPEADLPRDAEGRLIPPWEWAPGDAQRQGEASDRDPESCPGRSDRGRPA